MIQKNGGKGRFEVLLVMQHGSRGAVKGQGWESEASCELQNDNATVHKNGMAIREA